MEKETQQIKLWERIRTQSRWVFVGSNLKEDLTQEAYLLAVEYAEKNNKPLSELSNTEIKFRCFEAARKLRLKEITSLEDAGIFEAIPSEENIFENVVRAEEEKINSQKIAEVEWILQNHPALSLTPIQRTIYNELKEVTPRTQNIWKAYYARQLGVTRQDIYNIAKVVRRKFEFARDFTELCNGNVSEFFTKYGSEWVSPFMRRGILNVLLGKRFSEESSPIINRLRKLYDSMQKYAQEILINQVKKHSDGSFNSTQLARGYHLFMATVWTNPLKAKSWLSELKSEIPHDKWILKRIASYGLRYHSFMNDWMYVERYREWLKYLITHDVNESEWFAGYIVCSYGGGSEYGQEFLRSGGKFVFPSINTVEVIKETYKKLFTEGYKEYEVLSDIIFLRLILVFKNYPTQNLRKNAVNSLITLCQKSMHSKDLYVSKEAEKLLIKIKNREIISV